MTDTRGAATRARVLELARARFVRQGYASTSLAELAQDLGTTKAALYYYFPSKRDVLDALLERPLQALGELADAADSGLDRAELLGRIVDAMAGSCRVIVELQGDPSVLREHGERHDVSGIEHRILLALSDDQSPAGVVRATAALGAARSGVGAALALADDGELDPDLRDEIVRAAVAVLGG